MSLDFYKIAEEFVNHTNKSLFLTGKAGTGKTTFLRNIRKYTNKQVAVIAPTGIAAINANGSTIHSFFQLPFTPYIPTSEGAKNLISKQKIKGAKQKVIRQLELLIIDEISMVRADVMDAIDTMLRHIRHRPNTPYGGVQMLFIGDMHQLSPVTKENDFEILSQFYDSFYFFNSKVFEQSPPIFIELDHIFRQTDTQFIGLLNEIRNKKLSKEGFELLQSRYNPDYRPTEEQFAITLTTHNAKADAINSAEMANIDAPEFNYTATVKGDFAESSYPCDFDLKLKTGAKVMFIANDPEKTYYNGKLGIISRLSDKGIYVETEEGNILEVKQETWENIQYKVNKETNQIEEDNLGSFTQYPLRLAWAVTIHKSQGLTFDRVVIDAQSSFAAGQVYVALSRCRTLEGINLISPINNRQLINDLRINDFVERKPSDEELIQSLSESKKAYSFNLLVEVFNFTSLQGELFQLLTFVSEESEKFNKEGIFGLNQLVDSLSKLQSVARKFQSQIISLSKDGSSYDKLIERTNAASDYFYKELENLAINCKVVNIYCFSVVLLRTYNSMLRDLLSNIRLKQTILKGIINNISPENIYNIRKHFVFSESTFNAITEKAKSDKPTKVAKTKSEGEKKPKAAKAAKMESKAVTLGYIKDGKSIEEVARLRDFAVSTIEGHVIDLIKSKDLPITVLMTEERAKEILNFISQYDTNTEAINASNGTISWGDLRIAKATL